MRFLANTFRLGLKELASLSRDTVMLVLITYAFTAAVVAVAKGMKLEVSNAAVAVVDLDRSMLSGRIVEALRPPYFRAPELIESAEADAAMDRGRFTFVLQVPPGFEADMLAGRAPSLGLTVDATAMSQAGNGVAYIQQIAQEEVARGLRAKGLEASLPITVVGRAFFNPNLDGVRFNAIMQIINSVTILSIILVGAAVIREREHGTIEHLLVMPVRASEIALAKVWANGLVILVAVALSLQVVVRLFLEVPVAGSVPLFLAGTFVYLFATTSLGILLATVANSMPQLGLLSIPVFVTMQMLSGSVTPLESMPHWLQTAVQISPAVYFVQFSQAILYRGAGIDMVWQPLLVMLGIGFVFLIVAVARFKKMLARSG